MRTRRRHDHTAEAHARDRWLLSYSDLVTLLLGLFIVLYAASDSRRAKEISMSFAAEQTGHGILDGQTAARSEREELMAKLGGDPVLQGRTKFRETHEGIVISLSEAGFFAAGEAAINQNSLEAIDAVAETIKTSSSAVRVEGHTDSTPIATSKFPSNWELSTARASAVLAHLIERGISPERLSAAGFAGFRPVDDNATAEGRAQNRRVDIVIAGR